MKYTDRRIEGSWRSVEANAELGLHGCLHAVGVRRGTKSLQNGELEYRISSKIECKKDYTHAAGAFNMLET